MGIVVSFSREPDRIALTVATWGSWEASLQFPRRLKPTVSQFNDSCDDQQVNELAAISRSESKSRSLAFSTNFRRTS